LKPPLSVVAVAVAVSASELSPSWPQDTVPLPAPLPQVPPLP